MKLASIGFIREDGDLGLVATLNNIDAHMSDDAFNTLVGMVRAHIETASQQQVVVLERNDAPDYVTLEEKTNA